LIWRCESSAANRRAQVRRPSRSRGELPMSACVRASGTWSAVRSAVASSAYCGDGSMPRKVMPVVSVMRMAKIRTEKSSGRARTARTSSQRVT
jgi:hypothetical protein